MQDQQTLLSVMTCSNLKKYTADNDSVMDEMYNIYETALYFGMLRDKTLSVKSDIDKHDGFKHNKDCITLLLHS